MTEIQLQWQILVHLVREPFKGELREHALHPPDKNGYHSHINI